MILNTNAVFAQDAGSLADKLTGGAINNVTTATAINDEIAKIKVEIAEIQKNIDAKGKELQTKQTALDKAQNEYSKINSLLKENETKIEELNNNNIDEEDATDDEIKNLETELKNLKETELKTPTDSQKEQIKTLENQITLLSSYKTFKENAIKSYDLDANSFESDLSTKNETLKTAYDNLKNEYDTILEAFNNLVKERNFKEVELAQARYDANPTEANKSTIDQKKSDYYENKLTNNEYDRLKTDVNEQCKGSTPEACNKAIDDIAKFESERDEYNNIQKKFSIQNSLKETTFDVTKNLTLDAEGSQDQNYFNNKDSNSPIIRFILAILNYLTLIIGTLAVLLIIIGGFLFMASAGNENTIDKGKDIIKYAIIGLVITFFSYMIIIFIQAIFT